MSILASKRGHSAFDRKFSKELFSEVANNLRVFSDLEWATDKESLNYKRVYIAVYVRTDRDNLVLMIDKDRFASVSDIPPSIINSGIYCNTLIDAGLVCGKNLIDQAFNFKSAEAMQRLVMKSTCYPVGAVETSNSYALVYNVIIAEDLLRDAEISLERGFHFHPIESLYLTDLLQGDIAKSLILVKSEDKK